MFFKPPPRLRISSKIPHLYSQKFCTKQTITNGTILISETSECMNILMCNLHIKQKKLSMRANLKCVNIFERKFHHRHSILLFTLHFFSGSECKLRLGITYYNKQGARSKKKKHEFPTKVEFIEQL